MGIFRNFISFSDFRNIIQHYYTALYNILDGNSTLNISNAHIVIIPPHTEKTSKWLSQSAVSVAPNSFLLAHILQKQSTYPAKDVISSIVPEDHWLSSQTQFKQFLHTTTNQGMDYCLRNMETIKTLQMIKGWAEPVPLHSPKDHTQARKHHRYHPGNQTVHSSERFQNPCKNREW